MHLPAKIYFIVFVAFLQTINVLAQPGYPGDRFKHEKDSLIEVLKKYPAQDTARARALYDVVDPAIFLREKKEVMSYWEEAMTLSHKLNYKSVEAACLMWMATYYKSEQKIDSALLYLDSGIQAATASRDPFALKAKAFGLTQKARIYENKENFYAALHSYFDALECYGPDEEKNKKLDCNQIASIYYKLNNYDKSIEYYKIGESYSAVADIYFERNDIDNAKIYLDKLKPSMPDTIETQLSGGYYRLLGRIAGKEKKADSAVMYFKEALKYFNYTRFMHADLIAEILIDMTRLEMESGDMAAAKNYAMQSLAAARESGHNGMMAGALVSMAEYDYKTGNHQSAYRALREATILNDSVLTAANVKQANTLAAIYETGKKEKEITQLQADRNIQAAAVKQKSLLNTIFIIILAALLFIGALSFRNFKHTQVVNRQQQLIQQQKILQLGKENELMTVEAMLKGQEEERTRLAKDLHDGLGGMLSGVKISFSNMKENMIMDADRLVVFEKSIAQLDNTIEELRKVSHNLMPEALVKFGLKSAVKDFCDSMQSTGNVKIICEQLGTGRELGNIADVNVYRIIQELVNNALKHGSPGQILVQLTKTPAKVLITVEDNGKGFDLIAPQNAAGIGLANIKYRVNYLKGTIEINSKPGDGTTVNIELTA